MNAELELAKYDPNEYVRVHCRLHEVALDEADRKAVDGLMATRFMQIAFSCQIDVPAKNVLRLEDLPGVDRIVSIKKID